MLIYNDEHAKIIRGVVDISLWGGPYRLIATRAYEYIDRYKKAPSDHIADLLADKLEVGDPADVNLYGDVLLSAHQARETINVEYVMNSLGTFMRRQALRSVAVDLNKALTKDTEASLDEADQLIKKATQQQALVFDPGIRLSDKKQALGFLDIAYDSFPTGIPEFDKRGFGPTRKELWLGVANAKRGKSWLLIHLAKMAVAHRLKVLHISLEMSGRRCAQRYFQALFAMAKRPEKVRKTAFKRDDLGRLIDFVDLDVTPRLSLQDEDIRVKLSKLIDKWSLRTLDNILIKEFPTGQLTVPQLKAYLNNLETSEAFIPDLLIIDYPDLMKLGKSEPRFALDEIYKEIRGIAVERNIAVAIVSQAHRGSVKAKKVGTENVSEHFGKVMHADVVVTYSQTEAEKQLGLARLTVAAGRNDEDGFTVVISQQYAIGGFALDSVLMVNDYWQLLPNVEGEVDDE